MEIDILTEFTRDDAGLKTIVAATPSLVGGKAGDTAVGLVDITSVTDYGGRYGRDKTNDARDIGTCTPLYLNIQFSGTTIDFANGVTAVLELATADYGDGAVSVKEGEERPLVAWGAGTGTKGILRTGELDASQVAVGKVISIPLPSGAPYGRYLGVRNVGDSAGAGAFKIASAHLSLIPVARTIYGDAVNASHFVDDYTDGDSASRENAPE